MKIKSVFLLGAALILSATLFAQAPSAPAQGAPTMGAPTAPPPMTEKEVISELKKEGADQLLKDLNTRGVVFEMDPDTEKRLRKAKATDQVVQAVTQAGPKERAAAAKAAALASGGALLSPQESADFKALQSELDPDKAIALAEAYAQKYPKSDVLSYAYAIEANAYQMKNNAQKIVEYGEKSVDLKKDNLMGLLIVAYTIPTPQFVKLHDADEEKQLAKADGYCQDALKAIQALPKSPNESDADFAKRKATYTSNVHSDLGMIHLDRAQLGLMGLDKDELVKAQEEYKLAISLVDKPEANDYYRLGDSYRLEAKFDDAITAYTKASELSPTIKPYADKQVQMCKALKAQSTAAPKP
jgi:tetratricopeptide (TPR) repeat protein